VKPRIVIAGFGDTGLLVAAHLRGQYDVTAISTKPMLVSGQELGARLSNLEAWKSNYLMPFAGFKRLDQVDIRHGKAVSIQSDDNQITYVSSNGNETTLTYDALVLATGTINGFWRDADLKTADDIQAELSNHKALIEAASTIAIIGAGPTGVSSASNIKENFPDKEVHLFLRGNSILPGYHPKSQTFVTQKLHAQNMHIHYEHHVLRLKDREKNLQAGTVQFSSGQPDFRADCIIWATGISQPNSEFISRDLLDEDGFVRVNPYLQSPERENIFAIGDIAASDPNRSSARNMGAQKLAKNIDAFLSGKPYKMKPFAAPKHRWGSILGIQNEGMRIFTPKGSNVRVKPWSVRHILFPIFVDRMIYRGIDRTISR